jgi:acetyl esterase/lipase
MAALHPDLDPKKPPKITLRWWNIRLIRLLKGFVMPKGKRPDGVEMTVQTIGGVQVRIHRPTGINAPAALLWIHGGGLIVGTPSQDDARCAWFAKELGITVVGLAYRLAPEHPFPAALDDCMATWQAVQEHADALGIDPHRVAIGGGGLAASLALRIRDQGTVQPVAQLLSYPMIDDRTTLRTDVGEKEHLVWNHGSNTTAWSAYLGTQRGAHTLPPYAAAARHGDLSGLPPAWIGVGTLDLFHDEDIAYAQRLREAGVETTLEVVKGAYHSFDSIEGDAAVAREFLEMKLRFLRPLLTEAK